MIILPFATVMILMARYSMQKPMFDLLEGFIRHESDMVNYEVARAMCELKGVSVQ